MAEDREGRAPGADVQEALRLAREGAETAMEVVETAQDIASGEADAQSGLAAMGGLVGLGGSIASAAHAPAEARAVLGMAQQATALLGTLVEGVQQIAEALEGDGEHRHVELGFVYEDADTEWRVRSVDIDERIGAPYVARIELIVEDRTADPRALLGKSARLTLTRASAVRDLCGIVRRVTHGRASERVVAATVELVPALYALSLRTDSRIFQGMTVPEILDDVLGNALGTHSREVDISLLRRQYPKREYCAQYDESDLDFAHRLMEEEGISYHFEHPPDDLYESLVLTDDNSDFARVPTLGDTEEIPFVQQRSDIRGAEPVYELMGDARLTTSSVVVADFDWTRGRTAEMPLFAERRAGAGKGPDHERYDHTTGFTHSEYGSNNAYGANDAEERARLGHELAVRDAGTMRGAGAVTGFAPARVFTLRGHLRRELDGDYAITRVRHRAFAAELRGVFGDDPEDGGAEHQYENEFECIPLSVPYRPDRRTPRPRAHGVLTAIVVGPDGQEIYSDEHGRVKVQFHWDRLGVRDAKSSCFLRVMQAWAGPDRGFQTFPRIGDEVVVDFIGGDIDRPLVVGSLYNQASPPPYTDSAHWARTTIKTRTTPADGNKSNELRFDDNKDHEEIYLHASRDLNEVVDHCHTTSVAVDQSNHVGNDHSEVVDRDQSLHVKRNRDARIDKNENVTIGANSTLDITESRRVTIGDDESLSTGGRRDVYVGKHDDETYDGGRQVTVKQHDNLHVEGANKNVVVDSQYNIDAKAQFKVIQGAQQLVLHDQVYIESGSRAQLKTPDVRLEMNQGVATLRADTQIKLQVGGSTLVITSTGITLNAPTVSLQGAAGSALFDASGAEVNGNTSAKLTAGAMVVIQAGIVAIN